MLLILLHHSCPLGANADAFVDGGDDGARARQRLARHVPVVMNLNRDRHLWSRRSSANARRVPPIANVSSSNANSLRITTSPPVRSGKIGAALLMTHSSDGFCAKSTGEGLQRRASPRALLTTSREHIVDYLTPDVPRVSRASALVNACAEALIFTGVVPSAMSRADTFGPYARSFFDSSEFKLPPDKLTPAKSPFARE